MDIVQIQALIAKGRVVSITDIDPTQSFVQIGVYQPDNRKIGSANNTYPSFVIPLSELGGGGGGGAGAVQQTWPGQRGEKTVSRNRRQPSAQTSPCRVAQRTAATLALQG